MCGELIESHGKREHALGTCALSVALIFSEELLCVALNVEMSGRAENSVGCGNFLQTAE